MGQGRDENTVKKGTASDMHIGRDNEDYPKGLEKLPDPPDRLHVRGRIPPGPMIAIVGSRNADASVMRFVSRLAGELTEHGLAIVSGGALGIDTAAHQGALDAGGVTVAVIGSGFDYMYPETNSALFAEIARRGALVTEFASQQPPTKWTFPRRNRIVAALAKAVVVAQAGERSGALITARIASTLEVPLGAVPGAAGDPRNRGSHHLLRSGVAMVERAADVLALMERDGAAQQLGLPGVQAAQTKEVDLSGLSTNEVKILDLLGTRPVHIDEIIAGTGFASGETSAAILSLEVVGLIEDQGGKNFVRVG